MAAFALAFELHFIFTVGIFNRHIYVCKYLRYCNFKTFEWRPRSILHLRKMPNEFRFHGARGSDSALYCEKCCLLLLYLYIIYLYACILLFATIACNLMHICCAIRKAARIHLFN